MPATEAEEVSTTGGTRATTAKRTPEISTVYRGTATSGPTAALERTGTKQHR